MSLILAPNKSDPDGFYDVLLKLHHGLNKTRNDASNARLVLMLTNPIADETRLLQSLSVAQSEQ